MSSTAEAIIQYVQTNPDATGADVATHFAKARTYVASILARARKEGMLPPVGKGRSRRGAKFTEPANDNATELPPVKTHAEEEAAKLKAKTTKAKAGRKPRARVPHVVPLASNGAAPIAAQLRSLRDSYVAKAKQLDRALAELGAA